LHLNGKSIDLKGNSVDFYYTRTPTLWPSMKDELLPSTLRSLYILYKRAPGPTKRAPCPTPPLPPPRGQGVKERRCRQGDTPPATHSRLPLWGRRPVESTCRDASAGLAPSTRTVPTWASVARGGNLTQQDFTQQEAPAVAATPSDAIALYKRYVAMGYRACFSIKNITGYEEINLFCRFPDPPARSAPPT
jgi:hypothetical protein